MEERITQIWRSIYNQIVKFVIPSTTIMVEFSYCFKLLIKHYHWS